MSLLEIEGIETAALPAPIGPNANGMLMTAEEYDSADDWVDGYRYELIHGVLIVSPPAGIGERSPNDYLGYLLINYQESHAKGDALDGTAPEQEITIGQARRRADRAIWVGLGRPPKPLQDTPAIAIEFVSESKRDRQRDYVEKRAEY
ncbi:MAG: Uma2 family endonuclease, partial [Planctomycetota bacterium]